MRPRRDRKGLAPEAPPGVVALADERCRELPKGSPPLPPDEVDALGTQVPRWRRDRGRLVRDLVLADFKAALALTAAVGELAEAEGHHPDLHLTGYKRLRIETTTHSVGGLSRNDFILAAKVDRLPGAPA